MAGTQPLACPIHNRAACSNGASADGSFQPALGLAAPLPPSGPGLIPPLFGLV